ncbi:MAG: DNA gyrase subunit A [Bacilli bacterium]|nr:DNA gyrase subunit A [Bacilli bacterium]
MENEEKKDLLAPEENDEETANDENPEIEETEEVTEADEEAASGIIPGLIDRELTDEVENAFLNYSMSVIVSRAIPDVKDGLKPVQRRIIYGMDEAGMAPNKPHKKSARIVGDVMGKYHPHGDSALYLTLVRMAQPFSLRYTLVDGHGNFGSVDGDEPAAMRYTEARMNRLAVEMVRDLDKDTVDWVDNYDGSEKEPSVLPSRFPNLIVNGTEGIAVGMATNMPPHNLSEAIDAIGAVCKNPDISATELMQNYIFGPDFPTGGIILGRQGILDYYETGTGSVTIRSRYEIEEEKSGRERIVVTEIPYQVNKARLVESIGQLVRDKEVDGITDIRDESNKEGTRVVIEVRHDAMPEVVANNLLRRTQLQINFGVINLCLVNGEPKILSMKELIQRYIDHQIDVLTRRTKYLLKRDSDRDHIVMGLLLAHDNIDEVIHIIRDSKTDEQSFQKLNARFGLDQVQVDAILAMTLRRLQGLEQDKLNNEHADLQKNIAEYNRLLSDQANIVELMLQELEDIKKRFGDKRLTEISDQAANIDNEDLIPQKDVIVVLTRNGYLKRMDDDTFRTQNRGGRGVKGIATTGNDTVSIMLHTRTHTDLLFFTSLGKIYRTRGHEIPDGARGSKGIPAVNLLRLDQDEKVVSIVPCDDYPETDYLFFATVGGVVKRTALTEFERINSNGKRAISLREGDVLLDVKRTNGSAIIGLASSNGKVCSFHEDEVRSMGRDAAGVTGMDLKDGSHLVDVTTSLEGDKILVLTNLGFGKISYAQETTTEDGRHYDGYRLTKRGAKGVISLKSSKKTGELTAMRCVNGDEDLMVITNKGIVIRTPLEQVKIAGRNTQGVKIINLDQGHKVASLALVPHSDESEEETEEIIDEVNPDLLPPEEVELTEEVKVVTPDEVDEIPSEDDDDDEI